MASAGRPTQFQIAAQLGKSWRAVMELGADNRLSIPIDAYRRAPWLGGGRIALAIGRSDGTATLQPYEPLGPQLEAKLAELEKIGSEESEELMRAIRSTYLRLAIYDDRRVIIPSDIRMWLGLQPSVAAFLSLTIVGDKATLKQSGPREISEAASLLETIDL